jgi:replicative DNA helicase
MASEMMVQDRLPPHCIEAEESVLGSILIDSTCLANVRAIVTPGDFLRDKNKWVFEAMEALEEGIDQVTVANQLERMGYLEDIGGPAYLSHLVANTPTSVHAKYYAKVVAERAYERKVIETADKIAAMAYEAKGDSMDLYVKAQEMLAKLEPHDKTEIVGPQQHAELMLNMLCRRHNKELDCVPFGYRDLDDLISGMYGGDFTIVGARPEVGKSQLLLEIALHNAKLGRPVLYVSVEMSLDQIMEREVCMGAGIDMRRLRKGQLSDNLSDNEWGQAQAVVAEASTMPLHFLAGRLNVASIAQKARFLKQASRLSLVAVDYIQLLGDRYDKRAGDTLRERIGYISGMLKNIARDCDVPVIAASQFSRAVEAREGHRPMLADLKESGDLEQDADVVLLLHRPELYEPDKDKGILEMKIAKHRQLGVDGVVKLVWVHKEHRYRDMMRK